MPLSARLLKSAMPATVDAVPPEWIVGLLVESASALTSVTETVIGSVACGPETVLPPASLRVAVRPKPILRAGAAAEVFAITMLVGSPP